MEKMEENQENIKQDKRPSYKQMIISFVLGNICLFLTGYISIESRLLSRVEDRSDKLEVKYKNFEDNIQNDIYKHTKLIEKISDSLANNNQIIEVQNKQIKLVDTDIEKIKTIVEDVTRNVDLIDELNILTRQLKENPEILKFVDFSLQLNKLDKTLKEYIKSNEHIDNFSIVDNATMDLVSPDHHFHKVLQIRRGTSHAKLVFGTINDNAPFITAEKGNKGNVGLFLGSDNNHDVIQIKGNGEVRIKGKLFINDKVVNP